MDYNFIKIFLRPKAPIISKNASNKSCIKLNFVQKSQWAHVSISSTCEARGLQRLAIFIPVQYISKMYKNGSAIKLIKIITIDFSISAWSIIKNCVLKHKKQLIWFIWWSIDHFSPKGDWAQCLTNCGMCTHSSQGWLLSHCYWHVMRDGCTFFIRSRQGNNSSCITTARDVKSLCTLRSSTTHGRTSEKLLGRSTQLSYSVRGWWEWFSQANNYQWWKLDPFLWAIKKINEHAFEKKERKKHQENSRSSGLLGRWC